MSATPLPPWEMPTVARVPYLDPTAPPLTSAERQALPSLWAARSSTASRVRGARLNTDTPSGYPSFSPTSPEIRKPWSGTVPPIPPSYETPLFIPPPPKSCPNITYPHTLTPLRARAPPTPPDSISVSSTISTSKSPNVKALPGTMSARSREREPSKFHAKRTNRSSPRTSRDSIPFGQRLKSAFKEIFKKDPVDDSQFERVEARHWTEDY